MTAKVWHELARQLKSVLYSRRGEPYRIQGHTLRFVPGTRPVRLRYKTSENSVVRYDALQAEFFSKQLAEGDLAIDIGAHVGQLSIIMAAMCGQSGQVVAFEPDPYSRAALLRNLELNPQVKRPVVEPIALSDVSGEAVLFCLGGNSNSSLARSGIGLTVAEEAERIVVPLVTLDAYLHDKGWGEPRWVKIDTEGAEINILKGARQLLSGKSGVICELHPYAWPEFGNTLDDLKMIAAASGRRIRYLDQDHEIGGQARYGTVVLERAT
jgi:FkbM family methyltransferase